MHGQHIVDKIRAGHPHPGSCDWYPHPCAAAHTLLGCFFCAPEKCRLLPAQIARSQELTSFRCPIPAAPAQDVLSNIDKSIEDILSEASPPCKQPDNIILSGFLKVERCLRILCVSMSKLKNSRVLRFHMYLQQTVINIPPSLNSSHLFMASQDTSNILVNVWVVFQKICWKYNMFQSTHVLCRYFSLMPKCSHL